MKEALTLLVLGLALSTVGATESRKSAGKLRHQLQASRDYVAALADHIIALQGRNPFTVPEPGGFRRCSSEENLESGAEAHGIESQPAAAQAARMHARLERELAVCKIRVAHLRQQVVKLEQRDYAQHPSPIDTDRRRREDEAEILALRREVADLRQQLAVSEPGPVKVAGLTAVASAPGGNPLLEASPTTRPEIDKSARPAKEDDELAGALENALVRQGGRLLPRGAFEVEPELSYFYDEPTEGRRRDHFGTAVAIRAGLPGAMQAEVRLPYVLRDRWSGVGKSSGVGDIVLGLSKEVLAERDHLPAAIAFMYWKSKTGQLERSPATGSGQPAAQFGLSVTRRRDPVVLFGSLSYTVQQGSFRLRDGTSGELGSVLGARMGAMLAATPDTSLHYAVSLNSHAQGRLGGRPMENSDRLYGIAEFGGATTIGRGLFLNVSGGIGFTPAAPKFALNFSVPMRF